jgi:hypothetical protein
MLAGSAPACDIGTEGKRQASVSAFPEQSGARTPACNVGIRADVSLAAKKRREESRRGMHECVRHGYFALLKR